MNKIPFLLSSDQQHAMRAFAEAARDFRSGKISSDRLETVFLDCVTNVLDWSGTRQQRRKHFRLALKKLPKVASFVGGRYGLK